MQFKKHRIRKNFSAIRQKISEIDQQHPEQTAPKTNKSPSKLWLFIAGFSMVLVAISLIIWLIYQLISSLDFGALVLNFGQPLQMDKKQHTNFLLLGTGGDDHDGSNLTDTILVASYDHQDQKVKMLSLPRDLFLENLKGVNEQRINKLYDSFYQKNKDASAALESVKAKIGELMGIEIHYYAKVDFSGFAKIVDSLGGIEIDVPTAINDPYYPLGETDRYTTFRIAKGLQVLDGETALKYARSRKTTSDFDRAQRQQSILTALKEKAMQLNLLTDLAKLQQLYRSIDSSISTDLSIPEILELAKIAKSVDRSQISNTVLTDDFTSCGGLLYTPPRENYGGAAVLLPIGSKYTSLQQFVANYFFSNSFEEQAPIQVLNATKTPGLAGKYLNLLSRQCLNVIYYGNATDREQSTSKIYYQPDEKGNPPAALALVQQFINAPAVSGLPEEYLNNEKKLNTKIIIELAKDYKTVAEDDPFDFLPTPQPVTPTVPTTTTPTETPISAAPKVETNIVTPPVTPNE